MQSKDSPEPPPPLSPLAIEIEVPDPSAGPLPDPEPSRHREYYIEDNMAIFLVENTLFKVHRHFLIQESDVFHWMFVCPPGSDGPEGIDDQRPIALPGVLCKEFESLLDFFYHGIYRKPGAALKALPGRRKSSRILQQWIDLLSISTRYDFQRVRQCAVESVESHPALTPVEKIRLAEKYDIPHWRAPAFEALCQRVNPLNITEARVIGLENATLLAEAREAVREHQQLEIPSKSSGWGHLAASPPSRRAVTPPSVKDLYDRTVVRDIVRRVFFPELVTEKSE